ncbi:MAG: metalloregulator ArsR/SmtB family transcription factor [Paracoccaceae bacterium]|jgi:DNA-binding transcriptional ArsR family regulator
MNIQDLKYKLNSNDLIEKIAQAANLMAMLSSPVRLQLLCNLLMGEKSVQALVDLSGLSQPAISHHLRILREADLVQTRREQQTIYNALKGPEVAAILQTLHDIYCAPKVDPTGLSS